MQTASVSKGASDTNLTRAWAGVSRAAESRIRLQCRRPFGGECTSAFVLPHGVRCLPRRRGSDTLTYWLPLVPAKGMAGHQRVYRPLAGGKIACTSPSAASTVRGWRFKSMRGRNRAGSCLNQTASTLSVRGYAIGRWSRFDSWQGGFANAADRVIAVVQPVEPVRPMPQRPKVKSLFEE